MTRITRRQMLRLSALSSLGAALAACAPKAPAVSTPPTSVPAEATSAPTAVPATAAATAAPARAANLTYYIGFGAGGDPPQVEAVKKMFARYHEANPTIAVEPMVVAWEEAPRKFQAMIAAGGPPDVVTMGVTQWPFAAKGAFQDLRPLIEADKIDISDWDQTAVESFVIKPLNNLLYGLPHGLNGQLLFYNKTLWDAAGLKAPTDWKDASWTWDALLEAAKKTTKGSGSSIEQFGMMRLPEDWNIPWMYGGNWVSEDGLKIVLDAPENIKAFTYVQDEVFKNHVAPTDAEGQALSNGFLSGKVGIYFDGTWSIGPFLDIKEFEWDFAPLPYAPEVGIDKPRPANYYPDGLFISSKAFVPESWALVKWMLLDDDNYKEFMTLMSMIPARRKLQPWFYEGFWKAKAPNKAWSLIDNVWPYCQPQRLFHNLNWEEVNNTQAADLQALWTNESTPDKVIPALAKKLDAIWQRGIQQLNG